MSNDKYHLALDKLADMTKADMVEWQTPEKIRWSDFSRPNLVGIPYFVETLNAEWIALYEVRYRAYDDYDEPFWKHVPVIESITSDGTLLFRWPLVEPESRDLLELVRYRTSKVNSLLDGLIAADVPDKRKKKT